MIVTSLLVIQKRIPDLFLSFLTEQMHMMKIYLSILLLAITLFGDVSGYKRRDHIRGVKRPQNTRRNLMTLQSHQSMDGQHARAPKNSGRHLHV